MLLQSAEQRSKSAFNVQLPLTVLQQKSFCVISVNQILQKSYNILDIEKLLQYLISYKDIEERFCDSDIVCFHSAVNPTFFCPTLKISIFFATPSAFTAGEQRG